MKLKKAFRNEPPTTEPKWYDINLLKVMKNVVFL